MLTNRRRKEIAALGQKKTRERLGQTLVEGVRSVEAAVAGGAPLVEILVTEEARQQARVAAFLEAAAVPVHLVPLHELERFSDVETSQGILAIARTNYLGEDRLATAATILALDGVQDPGNVGTIVRTAAWFGAEVVLAGPGTADLYHPKVVRAAMGGLWDLGLARTADLAVTLTTLCAAGYATYGADLDGTAARAWTPRCPSVLVLGSEAHGISAEVHALLGERVAIRGAATRAGAESLNVAVAAGILLHAWLG